MVPPRRIVGTALACLVECATSSVAAFPCFAARHPARGAQRVPLSGQGIKAAFAPAGALLLNGSYRCAAVWGYRSGSRMAALAGGALQIRCLNRLIVEREDVVVRDSGGARIVLGEGDSRTKHVRNIIKAADGATLRVGVVDHGSEEDAVVHWAEDGSLELTVPELNTALLEPLEPHQRPRVDVLLALPRPSNLERFLCTSTQQGVGLIVLCNAAKVQADYFGSHMLQDPKLSKMRGALVEGLEQAGDTALPRVTVARRLKPFLEDELDALCPDTVRVVAHPQKEWLPPLPRLADVAVPRGARLLVAVGPEAGWQDPYELDLLAAHGFQAISLGERTLRTDVALISLVALAHDRLAQADAACE